MIDAVSLLVSLISGLITWFFTLNFSGVYIGWVFVAGVLIGVIIKLFLQDRGGDHNG